MRRPLPIVCSQANAPAAFTSMPGHSLTPDADGTIRWHIVNFAGSMEKHKLIRSFEHAYNNWQTVFDLIPPIGRVITFEPTLDFDKAHSRHWFLKPGIKEQRITRADGKEITFLHKWPFDGNGRVLAHVPPGIPDVYYDDGENWGELYKWQGNELFADLRNTASHEIGHTLDFGHSNVRDSIMYPTSDGRIELGRDDQEGANAIWGDKKTELAATQQKLVSKDSQDLLAAALSYIGIKEVNGEKSHPDIIKWIRSFFPNAKDDSLTAWCSIFLNVMCKQAGYQYTDTALARDWLKVGEEVHWDDRRTGDIIIFWRTAIDSWQGHVGIYCNDRDLEGQYVRVLGGNQNNSVWINTYSMSRFLGLRRLPKI